MNGGFYIVKGNRRSRAARHQCVAAAAVPSRLVAQAPHAGSMRASGGIRRCMSLPIIACSKIVLSHISIDQQLHYDHA